MSEIDRIRIKATTALIAKEIAEGRVRAHEKHGDNSIEAIDAWDARWMPILVEEVGEMAHELTYDAETSEYDVLKGLRSEALDVASVIVAWIARIDVRIAEYDGEATA